MRGSAGPRVQAGRRHTPWSSAGSPSRKLKVGLGNCVCPVVNIPMNSVWLMGRKLWDIFKSLRRPKQIKNTLTNDGQLFQQL